MSTPPSTIRVRQVRSWISQDPDPRTRQELEGLLQSHANGSLSATEELRKLFSGRLSFGTAGIRGPLRPGPAGMNRVVVGQTTAGLARYLIDTRHSGDRRPLTVVVGCDARTNSEVFLHDVVRILSGHGIHAITLPPRIPTPLVAFAVRFLSCDAGIMITASHNPPTDNGYKVYLGGQDEGSQIIPPVDQAIETKIAEVAQSLTWPDIPQSSDHVSSAPDGLLGAYLAQTISAVAPSGSPAIPLRVVYTPLHGVGAETFMALLDAAGFARPNVVEEQVMPDPDFPTVIFPNPEEEGALDLAYTKGRSVDAQLILAHDPDADRLAVAIQDKSQNSGYRMLTGNQLGAILGWRVAERAVQSGTGGTLANSLVSSPVLGKIAVHFGLDHQETLTGFKYVSRVPHLIFGFEEAMGYLVTPSVVRDKDGISAGLAVLDLAYGLAIEGRTLHHYLADIEACVGSFFSGQIIIQVDDEQSDRSLTSLLRENPPSSLGSRLVADFEDFEEGVQGFPKHNIIRLRFSDDSRVIVRPSGTEPKVKIYIDTFGKTKAETEATLAEIEEDIRDFVTKAFHTIGGPVE